jgi:hypothetical protein
MMSAAHAPRLAFTTTATQFRSAALTAALSLSLELASVLTVAEL